LFSVGYGLVSVMQPMDHMNILTGLNHSLDKYSTNQDVVYDYKSDLKGTGGLPICA